MPPELLPPVEDTHGINIPQRYIIRPLGLSVLPWVKALIVHGFFLNPSISRPLIPNPKTASALAAYKILNDQYAHSINSGLCWGIFDQEYPYKREASAAQGGALYWDELDPAEPGFDENGKQKMIDRIDFPLVCVALSNDAFIAKPEGMRQAISKFAPLNRAFGQFMGQQWASWRDEATWTPKEMGVVATREGCTTAPGHTGRGLATALNYFVMLELKALGYQAIMVGIDNPSIYKNWMNAPDGCKSTVAARIFMDDIELEDSEGNRVKPYVNSGNHPYSWLVWCDLRRQS